MGEGKGEGKPFKNVSYTVILFENGITSSKKVVFARQNAPAILTTGDLIFSLLGKVQVFAVGHTGKANRC